MGNAKYMWFLIVASCAITLYITLLLTTNLNCRLSNKTIEPLPTLIAKSKPLFNLVNDTLVNLRNFKFIMNNVSICENITDEIRQIIVIMVHSARSNFNQRYAIRNTWGSVKSYRQWRLHLIFLLGSDISSSTEFETQLSDESIQHGDIIMGDFIDSYRNLSYKHLMGYKWVSTFCPTAKFILKTDDDIYADIFQIIDIHLMDLINAKKTYACENMGGNKPIREPGSKWYVPKDLYSEDSYPDFCSGSAYLMNAGDAAKIYSVSKKTNFFWIDDVYVTGILREKYNRLTNHSKKSSLEILTLYDRHHLGGKKDIISWCSKGIETKQLTYSFILLNRIDFISDMFCVWNKIRLMKYVMDLM